MYIGDFIKEVLPFRDILELTIRTYDAVQDETNKERYRLILTNADESLYGGVNSKLDKDRL